MNICTAVNSKYVKYLLVMMASLFENNTDEEIVLHILYCDLSDADKECISAFASQYGQQVSFLYIDRALFSNLPSSDRITIESYFRLVLPGLLNQTDRILYLDVDLIVCGELSPLYYSDFNDNYACVCQDMILPVWDRAYQKIFNCNEERKYFNAGVMLWNLGKIREDFSFDSFMDVAKNVEYELPHHDQSILNYCFYGKVKFVDSREWNYLPGSEFRDGKDNWGDVSATIIHYATMHPWDEKPKPEIVQRWWEYAKKTPCYVQLLEEQVSRLENNKADFAYKEMQRVEIKSVLENMLLEAESGQFKERIFDKCIVLYGAGYMADRLMDLLEFEGISDIVETIVDKGKKGIYRGFQIQNDFSFIESKKEYLLVVTPSYRQYDLINEIKSELPQNVECITLLSFVRGDRI